VARGEGKGGHREKSDVVERLKDAAFVAGKTVADALAKKPDAR